MNAANPCILTINAGSSNNQFALSEAGYLRQRVLGDVIPAAAGRAIASFAQTKKE